MLNDENNNQQVDQDEDNKEIDMEELDETLQMIEEFIKDLSEENKKMESGNIQKKLKVVNQRRSKIIFVNLIKEIIVSYLLIFMLDTFFNIIDSSFLVFNFYVVFFILIDFSFNTFIKYKFPLVSLLSFGLIHGIVNIGAFIVSAIICLQLFEIKFESFGICLLFIFIFIILKNLFLRYLFINLQKLKKKGKK